MIINKYKSTIFMVVIAYTFSWLVWAIPIFTNNYSIDNSRHLVFIILGSFGPTIGALIASYIFDGLKHTKALLKSIFIFKFNWKSYLFILLGLPLVVSITFFMGGMRADGDTPLALLYITILIASLNGLLSIFTGSSLGEELGWRGYLLPKLLNRKGSRQD